MVPRLLLNKAPSRENNSLPRREKRPIDNPYIRINEAAIPTGPNVKSPTAHALIMAPAILAPTMPPKNPPDMDIHQSLTIVKAFSSFPFSHSFITFLINLPTLYIITAAPIPCAIVLMFGKLCPSSHKLALSILPNLLQSQLTLLYMF